MAVFEVVVSSESFDCVQWNVPGARAVVQGAATLEGEWKAVEGASAAEKAAMRFFKVVVEAQ